MNTTKFKVVATLVVFILVFVKCSETKKTATMATFMVNSLPTNAMNLCFFTQSEFDSLFVSGKATENGPVHAANSVDLIHNTNCQFYQWASQMFLWLTSPTSGGEYTLNSPTFYTVSPADSLNQRTLIPHVPGQALRAFANVSKDGLPETEESQATDDVLMSKDGSLLYYITMVNDVYAQFLTAAKGGLMAGNQFPTTQASLDSVVNFANLNGVTLTDSSTLTMELKTSWVDARTLSDASNYVQVKAIIPTYNIVNDTLWTPSGETTATLALVGIHIVGSVSNHPEMVWASFEHKSNTPNASYSYLTSKNTVMTVPAETGGDWLLNSNASDPSVNISHMVYNNPNIVGNKFPISPSNTVRTKPWGSSTDVIPNQLDTSISASNSEIISINNSLQSLLVGNDIRKNYIFLGATWTPNGLAPTGKSYTPKDKNSLDSVGVAIGTSQLANSTMETYAQNGTTYNSYGSCFGCHHGSEKISGKTVYSLNPGKLSHVYSEINPLPTKLRPPLNKK